MLYRWKDADIDSAVLKTAVAARMLKPWPSCIAAKRFILAKACMMIRGANTTTAGGKNLKIR